MQAIGGIRRISCIRVWLATMNDLAPRVRAIMATYYLPGLFENLRQVGEDKFRGVCPMHGGDNRNGFGVEKYRGEWRWRCFTGDCGGGSAIDIIMAREHCTFAEAVELLDGGASGYVAVSRGSNEVDRLVPGRENYTPQPPSSFLVCDACRREVLEVVPKTYGNGTTRPYRTETLDAAVLRAADSAGWELSAHAEYAIGRSCMDEKHGPPRGEPIKIILMFDGDRAGRNAIMRAIKTIAEATP
jgi:CHC2 zinc finger